MYRLYSYMDPLGKQPLHEVWVLREYKEIEPIILSVGEEDEALGSFVL